jgi:hypothetical protein
VCGNVLQRIVSVLVWGRAESWKRAGNVLKKCSQLVDSGRILTHRLTKGGAACNIGANFIHGCDQDGGNSVFNAFRHTGLESDLVSPEYGIEIWYV